MNVWNNLKLFYGILTKIYNIMKLLNIVYFYNLIYRCDIILGALRVIKQTFKEHSIIILFIYHFKHMSTYSYKLHIFNVFRKY